MKLTLNIVKDQLQEKKLQIQLKLTLSSKEYCKRPCSNKINHLLCHFYKKYIFYLLHKCSN